MIARIRAELASRLCMADRLSWEVSCWPLEDSLLCDSAQADEVVPSSTLTRSPAARRAGR